MSTLLLSIMLEVLVWEIRGGEKKRRTRNEMQRVTKTKERREGVKQKRAKNTDLKALSLLSDNVIPK